MKEFSLLDCTGFVSSAVYDWGHKSLIEKGDLSALPLLDVTVNNEAYRFFSIVPRFLATTLFGEVI
jgi:hypothetical protein